MLLAVYLFLLQNSCSPHTPQDCNASLKQAILCGDTGLRDSLHQKNVHETVYTRLKSTRQSTPHRSPRDSLHKTEVHGTVYT
ncbi:hypothetical protein RRG08_036173 [Elysia crispata]|uniref:Secreted protein n=1 Tax=Elysia crispata TaxID=231223 RepID=A0AAE0XDZ4_9GAST|nr:hypothetical protein RRG08_036173 [Elysia crispata]